MIFMKEYWTHVDHSKPIGNLGRLVRGTFDAREYTAEYSWKDLFDLYEHEQHAKIVEGI